MNTVVVIVYFLFLVMLAYIINRRVKKYEDYSVASVTTGCSPRTFDTIAVIRGPLC